MNFIEANFSVYANYATWEGRARRTEYWYFQIFLVLLLLFPMLLFQKDGVFVALAFYLFSIIPQISVTVRRLHDTNHSGWWYWISLVPIVGLFLFYLLILSGDSFTNDYGEDPRTTWR